MRHRSRLFAAALACALGLAGCGSQRPAQPEPAGTAIPDDFPLSSGMGGPDDTIPTSRTGAGLRDLEVCGTAPLRGLGTRDRMVADNSGGEAAHTRELVLLGSPEEAEAVARSFADLASGCDSPAKDGFLAATEVRESPFGPAPTATLLQTYTVDGETAPGTTVVQVVPAGAALLVTSMYGEWAAADLEGGIAETVDLTRDAVSAMAMFDAAASPSSEASPEASSEIADDFSLLSGWPADSTAETGLRHRYRRGRGPDHQQQDCPADPVGEDGSALVVRHGGHAGYPSGDGQQQIDAMGSQASEAIAKMCVFTETGC